MDIFTTFATDTEAEAAGRWFPIGTGAKLKVARSNTPAYRKALRTKIAANNIDLADKSDATEALVETIVAEVLAETVLVGWEGLTFKGEPLEFNKANAAKILAFKDFRAKVQSFSDSAEGFRFKEEQEQGNV